MSQDCQETLKYNTWTTQPPDNFLTDITNVSGFGMLKLRQHEKQKESKKQDSAISGTNIPTQNQVQIIHEPTWNEIYLAACPPFLIKAILSRQCMIAPIENLLDYLKDFKRNWKYPLSAEGVLQYMRNANIEKMPTTICNQIVISPLSNYKHTFRMGKVEAIGRTFWSLFLW